MFRQHVAQTCYLDEKKKYLLKQDVRNKTVVNYTKGLLYGKSKDRE